MGCVVAIYVMRLFLAIVPPRDIRSRLTALQGGLLGAHWQADDKLHLTVRFVGKVDRHFRDSLIADLACEHLVGGVARLAGLGYFSRKGRVDQLWAGIKPAEGLRELHRKCDRICVSLGLEPEHRKFVPHVTLARFSRTNAPGESALAGYLAEYGGLAGPDFTFDELVLFESHMTPKGSHYIPVATFPLAMA